MGIALHAQSLYPDFSKLNFGCDGNSITAGEQWSKTVVDKLGFATHHNVAVGSATWACHPDTQDYGSEAFAGISGGWQATEDKHELQMRHNNVSKVHIQKFIAEVESGAYPAPDVFVFSMGTNDRNLGSAEEALKGKMSTPWRAVSVGPFRPFWSIIPNAAYSCARRFRPATPNTMH